METILWNKIGNNGQKQGQKHIQQAANLIRQGSTVAFPTETVYGLGADARSTEAVKRIFAAKGRPSDNPLIVHIGDPSELDRLTTVHTPTLQCLIDRFWPGPLTFVLPVQSQAVSPLVTARLDTVAVRMPDHPVALELIREAGCPIAAPSANRSGKPSPTRAEHVREDLQGRIGGILDGGPCGIGLESTVVEVTGSSVTILRPGAVTTEDLRACADIVGESAATGSRPRSPGTKYVHYAPEGALSIVKGRDRQQVAARIQQEMDAVRSRGESTGVLTFKEHASFYKADAVVVCGSRSDIDETARCLYDALREFDSLGIRFIFAEICEEEGVGVAVANRLLKAAGHRVIEV